MRALLVSLLVVVGCTSEIVPPVGSGTHALDCVANEICPDGAVCPDDGVCPEPGGGWAGDCDALAQACANPGGDGPDPAACADWLDACFPNGVGGGGDGGGGGGGEECGDLALACLNDGGIPDREACGQWIDACASDALQDFVGDDLVDAAERACALLDVACDQGMEDGCWLSDELCPFDGGIDPGAVRDHACGLLDEVCARGFGEACEAADALGCADAAGGGGGGDACGDLLATCTSDWDRAVCFEWFESCAPAEWRGEGAECADSLHACGAGDLAQCQAWLQDCPPDSVREPACVDALTGCYAGDAGQCADIPGACL